MDNELYSDLSNAFSDTYCEDGKIGIAKLYASIQVEANELLKAYMEIKEEYEDE